MSSPAFVDAEFVPSSSEARHSGRGHAGCAHCGHAGAAERRVLPVCWGTSRRGSPRLLCLILTIAPLVWTLFFLMALVWLRLPCFVSSAVSRPCLLTVFAAKVGSPGLMRSARPLQPDADRRSPSFLTQARLHPRLMPRAQQRQPLGFPAVRPAIQRWLLVPLLHAGAGALRSDAAAQWEAHPFFGHLWRGALLNLFCAPPIACEALLHVLQSQQDLARQDGRQLSLSEASPATAQETLLLLFLGERRPAEIAAAADLFVLHSLSRAMERPQHLRHHLLGPSLSVTLGNQSNLSSQPAHATLARLLRKSPPASL
ncbi:unnamed protein product, partial [Effrenium voratum]